MDGVTHIPESCRAELLGDDHACAEADAVDEAYKQENEVACAADGGKGPVAEQIAHDEGIGGVVELLKEVSEKQGNGKEGDGLPYGAAGHAVFGRAHGKCPQSDELERSAGRGRFARQWAGTERARMRAPCRRVEQFEKKEQGAGATRTRHGEKIGKIRRMRR